MVRVQKIFTKPSLTKQCFKDECDVNEIMRRFRNTQDPEILNRLDSYSSGQYGDFSDVGDYRAALDQVKQAEGLFLALPPKVRRRFRNSAAEFLDFCQDPSNIEEAISLGIATKRAPLPNGLPSDPVSEPQK